MELELRRKPAGGYWRGSLGLLGQSGETDEEGSGLPTDSAIDYSSGEVDYPTEYPAGSMVGPQLTPQDAAQRAAGDSWLSTIPAIFNAAGKVILSGSQISAGVSQGAVVRTANCASGYMVSGKCVQPSGTAGTTQLIPGLDNRSLAIIGVGLALLLLLGGRRK